MDELVYLFELDSVRNSAQEILRGQQALFREIALKGNRVVLSFNQLTDSEAFLWAVRTSRAYQPIVSLFAQGAIRYSRFVPNSYRRAVDGEALSRVLADCRAAYPELFQREVVKDYGILPQYAPQRIVRTASHYVQNGVERCLSAGGEQFLFSALPFRANDKASLSAIRYALQYSDPSILDGMGAGEERWRMEFAKTYVELILRLSREPLASNPANMGDFPPLETYLTWVIDRCGGEDAGEKIPLLPLLRRGAEKIRALWPEIQADGRINDRSSWHGALRRAAEAGEDREVLSMAEAVVDLCYNYTVAASIQGAVGSVREEEPFWADFLLRLPSYWEDGQTGIHQFLKPDSTAVPDHPAQAAMPNWTAAERVVRYAPPRGTTWGRRVVGSLLTQIRSAGAYIALFLAVSVALEAVEGVFLSFGEQIHIHPAVLPLLNILVFGIVGSQVSGWLHLMDIWDSFRQFGAALGDGGALLSAWMRDRKMVRPAPSGTNTGDKRPE